MTKSSAEGRMNIDYGYAQSTITATIWLIKYAPERLENWLRKHHGGSELEAIAREQMNERSRA